VSDTEAQNVTFYDVSLVSTGASVVLGALGDTATGGAGDDTVIGGKGADIINGGDGTDVVSYSDVAAAGTDQHGIADAGLLGVVANFTASAITTATIDTAMDTANTSDEYFTFGSTAVAANVATYIIAAADTAGGNVNDTYSNVEGVIGSERADYLALGTGAFSAVGGAGKDYILGGVGNNTITGGAGADTLVGGDGDDTYVYLAQAELVASNAMVDQITEASSEGTDTIQLSSVSGTFTIAKTDNFSTRAVEMESITVVASSNAYSITTHADFVSDTGIAIIDLSGDTTAGGSNVIDMSNQTTTTAMTVTGSAGVDTITLQETSADTVKGGAGIDVLDFNGGTTADVLDVTGANSTGNYDTVAQFVVGSDKIALDAAATTVATASGADAVVEDEATAAAGADGAVYDLATALDLNTNAVDLVTLDTNVLANISNLAAGGLDEAGTINDGTELLKALVTAGAGDTASGIKVDNAGDSFYILTDDGTDSYLYFLDAGDNDVAVAAEIILVADFAGATLDGIAAGQIVIA
jgi:Ca2+-binding RTX toxin-like protein